MKMEMKDGHCCSSVHGYVLRLAVGGLLLVSGIGKISGEIENFVTQSAGMFENTLMPMAFAKGFLTLVPIAEVVLGALLILGLFTRYAALVSAFLFALFVVGLTVSGKIEVAGMIANNFLFIFASLWLAKMSCGKFSLDSLMGCGEKS